MTWWIILLCGAAMAVGLLLLGWAGHRWWCMRRMGCPVWVEENAKNWDAKEELNGWRWSDRNKHRGQRGPAERHPTPLPTDAGKGTP